MGMQRKLNSLWGNLFESGKPQVGAICVTWLSSWMCFFAWCGIVAPMITAPMITASMKDARDGVSLTLAPELEPALT